MKSEPWGVYLINMKINLIKRRLLQNINGKIYNFDIDGFGVLLSYSYF